MRVTLLRDAAGGADPGAPYRPAGRAGLQQLLQVGRSHQRARPAQGRAARARQRAAAVRRRGPGAGRHGAGGGPGDLLPRGSREGDRASQHHRRARARSPSCRRPESWPRAAHVRPPGPGDRRAGWAPRRSRSTMRSRRWWRTSRSITSGSTRCPATARATATTTSTLRSTAAELRRLPRALIAARPASGARLRPGALLRGLPAGRGDGAARAGDAPLRPDEAGRAARPAHRAGAPRGGPAPAGGQGRADVEPRRLPDPASDPGAAAGVPDRFRGSRGAEFLRFGSIHRNAYLNSPASLGPGLTARDDDRLFFAGQLTGVEGYTESLGTGLLAGINLARRLQGRPAAVPPPTTMLGGALPLSRATRTPATSSR